MQPIIVYGDSIPAGNGVAAADAWPTRMASYFGAALTNNAVNGSQAADLSYLTYGFASSAANNYAIMVGANDADLYNARSNGVEAFTGFLLDIAAYIALPSRVTGRQMSLSGSGWADVGSEPFGIVTYNGGDSATCTVQGTAVYISHVIFAGTKGQFDVNIDGVDYGTFGIDATGLPATQNGRSWAPACIRVGGLTPGSHVIKITENAGGGFIDWVAGSQQASTPSLRIANLTPRSAAWTNVPPSLVAAYGTAVEQVVNWLASDGLNVKLIDVSTISPVNDLQNDGLHPRPSGHQGIQTAAIAVGF